MAVRTPGIWLEIDRIVIDGLVVAHRDRFMDAFTAECAAGLADVAFESTHRRRGRLDIALGRDHSAETLGRALARGIVSLVTGA
jgi:hypothetical protein